MVSSDEKLNCILKCQGEITSNYDVSVLSDFYFPIITSMF
jgi:hypothetical protein